ncbi:hypothetical protein SDC9_128102 [bioreactor metagenome]|uniref:Uncharacterized protein n=1 Tax=bioreactor metagenome TaxID=1076179 RepID=A0A645CV65_9ZZZZ
MRLAKNVFARRFLYPAAKDCTQQTNNNAERSARGRADLSADSRRKIYSKSAFKDPAITIFATKQTNTRPSKTGGKKL